MDTPIRLFGKLRGYYHPDHQKLSVLPLRSGDHVRLVRCLSVRDAKEHLLELHQQQTACWSERADLQ